MIGVLCYSLQLDFSDRYIANLGLCKEGGRMLMSSKHLLFKLHFNKAMLRHPYYLQMALHWRTSKSQKASLLSVVFSSVYFQTTTFVLVPRLGYHLLCSMHLHTLIWMQNTDTLEKTHQNIRSIPHQMPSAYS